MRRTIATLGIVGLGLMTATVSAHATPPDNGKMITICHATGSATNPFVVETINLNALNGHTGPQHTPLDIVPANDGDIMPEGQNLTAANKAILANGCAAVVVPPAEETPGEETPGEETPGEETPGEETPGEETPGEETPGEVTPGEVTPESAAPAAAAPAAAAPASAAAVVAPKAATAAAKKTNVGYNVQTAVGQTSDTGLPVWLMALTGVLTAGAAMVVWQGARRTRSTEG